MAFIRSAVLRTRVFTPNFVRCCSTDGGLVLNFATPHGAICHDRAVENVQLTSVVGEYGVTAGHTPNISQLVPGKVTITAAGGEPESYFVSGGYAMMHPSNNIDV